MKRAEIKPHLLSIAAGLFGRHGYNGVGVDRIIDEAGVAKTTLYRHFRTKEDLIVAVLRREDEAYRAEMRRFVEAAANDPEGRLLATFDYLEQWFREKDFYGCPFMSAASEFNDPKNPIFLEARLHKKLTAAYFEELARAAGLADPAAIAAEINLLHEGATAVAQIAGDETAAARAKAAARKLISEAGLAA